MFSRCRTSHRKPQWCILQEKPELSENAPASPGRWRIAGVSDNKTNGSGVQVKTSNHSRYLVKSLVHASRVLESFQSAGDVLRLRDVVTRTGFHKGMCFRLLYTLHQCGFLDKVGENHYRLASEVRRRRSGDLLCRPARAS